MMSYPHYRRESRQARWAWRLSAFAFVLLVLSALAHRFAMIDTPPFLWLMAIVAALACAGFATSWAALARLWQVDETGIGRALMAALVALVVLVPFGIAGARVATHPRLADIATDPADPPSLAAAAARRTGGMNPVRPIDAASAELQRENYPEVAPRIYDHPALSVYEDVQALVQELGWRVVRWPDARSEAGRYDIEATATTLVFGFAIDVGIRITDLGPSSRVDVRSASRYGSHDLGDNAARIVAFLERLDERVGQRLPVATE